jgi:exopolysaccharide production protein ExoY
MGRNSQITFKRLFDVVFSAAVLLLGSPVFFLCAFLIKCSSRGPVFYSCQRVGWGGKPFACWKFRTMFDDAEEKLQTLLASDAALMQEWKVYYKLKQDPRVTWAGKVLRKTSLDELPQFWNVLKGEMSVVGPRPLTQDEIVRYLKERAEKILSIRPGLTGLWVVKGRNHLTLEERIGWEEFYVDHRSFWMDLRLIAATFKRMIFPKGVY